MCIGVQVNQLIYVRCSHSVFKDMDMPLFLASFLQDSYIFFADMFKCYVALCSTSQNDVNNTGYGIGRFGKQNECFTKINYMYTSKTYMYMYM